MLMNDHNHYHYHDFKVSGPNEIAMLGGGLVFRFSMLVNKNIEVSMPLDSKIEVFMSVDGKIV